MKNYKWMGAAMVLGLAFLLAIFIVKPIGVSTQFSVLSGIIHSTINPDVITENPERASGYESTNAYYDEGNGRLAASIKNPLNYDFIFVLAIPLGAFVGSKLLNIKNKNTANKIKKDKTSFNYKLMVKTYLPAFLSGFLILFGARMADGCTSGHMMSGIMQGSVSGFIFTFAVFSVAAAVSILISRKNIKKGVMN